MCGISVVFSSNPTIDDAHARLMMRAQHHRGPDACGLVRLQMPKGQQLFLAHNRLRISDLRAAADQPFISNCKRYSLVFNGQIYNHLALRHSLRVFDIAWQTSSDTETLLYLLIWLGNQIIDGLEGMFAFAFADTHTGKLLLARDRFGIKPLYFAANNGVFLAASQARAITFSGLHKPELEACQIAHYLTYKFAERPYTLLKGVFELEPGYMIELSSPDSDLEPSSFIVRKPNVKIDFESHKFEQLLSESVRTQWPDQVPAGLMLSGGSDSVLLLAMLNQAGHKPDAFIAAQKQHIQDPSTDLFFAQKAINQYGGKLHIVEIDQNLPDQISNWLENTDLPVADGAAFLTQLVAKKAAEQGIKVLFSGAGADELFAGYRRHFAFWQYLKHFEGMPWDFMRKHSEALPAHKQIKTRFKDLGRAIAGFSENPYQTFLALTSQNDIHQAFFKPEYKPSNLAYYAPSYPATSEFYMAWALEHDKNQYLCSDILAITDKSSMQASIETRLPFLDNKLSAWVAALPIGEYMQKGQKYHIRESLLEKNGRIYAQRPKQGFGSPLMQWLRAPQYRHWFGVFEDNSNSAYQVLEPGPVRQLVNDFLDGKIAADNQVLALLLLFHWIKNNNL